MIGIDSDHYHVVAESLAGNREVDEHTFDSVAVLAERLERVRDLDGIFAGIEFSPDVEQLQSRARSAGVA